jgi:NAD-dependent deacetylase
MEKSEICANFVRESNKIVALTGAGISTAAGIPDFRGPQGIYTTHKYDPEKVFDILHFSQDPAPFYDYARDFLRLLEGIKPTFTHRFFAKLEEQGKMLGVITQNIDGLHEKAGSHRVINLHGSIKYAYCLDCGRYYDLEAMKEKIFKEKVPRCDTCGGILKPDIVFFGEAVKDFNKAEELVYSSDLMFVVGTSCKVYPANMLLDFARGKIVFVGKGDIRVPCSLNLIVSEDIDTFFREVSGHIEDISFE